ncbi:MAG: hypothetical protein AAFQ98_16865 [Bacteroidota bacterium]
MKIPCACGHVIIDQTDGLSNKGHLISDTQWFAFWEAIDDAIENSGPTAKEKEAACMRLRQQNPFKLMWECPQCGRLYVDGAHGEVTIYQPENQVYNQALNRKA